MMIRFCSCHHYCTPSDFDLAEPIKKVLSLHSHGSLVEFVDQFGKVIGDLGRGIWFYFGNDSSVDALPKQLWQPGCMLSQLRVFRPSESKYKTRAIGPCTCCSVGKQKVTAVEGSCHDRNINILFFDITLFYSLHFT